MLHHMKRPSFNDMVVHYYHHSIDTGTFFGLSTVSTHVSRFFCNRSTCFTIFFNPTNCNLLSLGLWMGPNEWDLN